MRGTISSGRASGPRRPGPVAAGTMVGLAGCGSVPSDQCRAGQRRAGRAHGRPAPPRRRRPASRCAPARGGRTRSRCGSPRARPARSCRARPRSRTRPGSGPWPPRCARCRRPPRAALPGRPAGRAPAGVLRPGPRVPAGQHPGLRLRHRHRARDGPAVDLVITARAAAERGGRREGPAGPGHPSEQRADGVIRAGRPASPGQARTAAVVPAPAAVRATPLPVRNRP